MYCVQFAPTELTSNWTNWTMWNVKTTKEFVNHCNTVTDLIQFNISFSLFEMTFQIGHILLDWLTLRFLYDIICMYYTKMYILNEFHEHLLLCKTIGSLFSYAFSSFCVSIQYFCSQDQMLYNTNDKEVSIRNNTIWKTQQFRFYLFIHFISHFLLFTFCGVSGCIHSIYYMWIMCTYFGLNKRKRRKYREYIELLSNYTWLLKWYA